MNGPDRVGGDGKAAESLDRLRERIEALDRELVNRLAERVALAREIGALKRAVGLPTLDPSREAAVVRRACAMAREADLDAEAVRTVYWQIIGLTRRAQGQQP